MAQDQSEKTLTFESNPSEATLAGDPTGEGKMLSMIGSDDFVIAKNIFDGETQIKNRAGKLITLPKAELILKWANVPHRWKPGQTVNLPGYKGRHFLLHLTKTVYIRALDDAERNDRRDYALSDPVVSKALVKIQAMMSPDQDNATEEVQEMPDYVAGDDNLQAAMGGAGDQVLDTVKDDQPDATIESEAKFDDDSHNITPSTIDAKKAADKAAKDAPKTAPKTAGNLPS